MIYQLIIICAIVLLLSDFVMWLIGGKFNWHLCVFAGVAIVLANSVLKLAP